MYVTRVKPHTCSLCGKSFRRRYHLKRHEQSIHSGEESNMDHDSEVDVAESVHSEVDNSESERESSDAEMEEEEQEEESEVDDEDRDEDMSSDELEDNTAFLEWYAQAKEATQEMRTEKYEKYINAGMDEDQANEKANMKVSWAVKRFFFNRYKTFLSRNRHLKDNETHQDIVADLEEKTDKGMEIRKALTRVLGKHQAKFEGLFQHEDEDDEEEMEDSEDQDSSD